MLNLYEYEKQVAEYNPQNINFEILYETQQKQNELLEMVFSNDALLRSAKFVANSTLFSISVNADYTRKWNLQTISVANDKKYKITFSPEAIIAKCKEVFSDELDVYLLNATETPKSFEEIKTILMANFDEEEVAQNPQSFDFVIQNRIKYAINNNLILCQTLNEYSS